MPDILTPSSASYCPKPAVVAVQPQHPDSTSPGAKRQVISARRRRYPSAANISHFWRITTTPKISGDDRCFAVLGLAMPYRLGEEHLHPVRYLISVTHVIVPSRQLRDLALSL
jgi:hypothetical protein